MSGIRMPGRGLYAITREGYSSVAVLAEAVAAAIRGGAAVVQYRAKSASGEAEAEALRAVCRQGGVPFIINDDVALARRTGADGVHLGREDAGVSEARAVLGPEAIIGVSCYDSLEQALLAEAAGADYVAFGRFFPSGTKPGAPRARLETLAEARRRLKVPIVAIGGITPDNGGALLEAGADLLAVIEGVFGGDDPKAAARRFGPLFAAVC